MKGLALSLLLLAQVSAASQPQEGTSRVTTGTISGVIRMQDGTPAVGIRVSALTASAEAPGGALISSLTQTDEAGRYQLEQVPPGSYYVAVGLLESPTYFPGVNVRANARVVVVQDGESVANVSFTFTPSTGVRVSGRVTGIPRNLPAEMVRVMLPERASSNNESMVAPVQLDGAFEFLHVRPGTYTPELSYFGAARALPKITVDDINIDGLELPLPPVIVGRLEIEGGGRLPPAYWAKTTTGPDSPTLLQIRMQRMQDERPRCTALGGTYVRSDGYFLLPGDSGEYQVGWTLPLGYYFRSASYGAVDLLKEPLRLGATPTGESARIVLTTVRPESAPPEFKVSGKVSGIPNGKSPRGHWVHFRQGNATPCSASYASTLREGQAQVRDDGTFEATNVTRDDWMVKATDGGSLLYPGERVIVENHDVSDVDVRILPPLQLPEGGPVLLPPLN
jgi:hypothetical protein